MVSRKVWPATLFSLCLALEACGNGDSRAVVGGDIPDASDASVTDVTATDKPAAMDAPVTDMTDVADVASPPDATDVVTDAMVTCPPELTACGTNCVDTRSDRENCGSCASRCAPGEACSGGTCSVACASPLMACGEAAARRCVDPTVDPANCGSCGRACAAGESCVSGTCTLVCPAGQTRCGSACRDLQRDGEHCGACDAACAAGQACRAGRCELNCPTGQTACGSACRDLGTDEAHCGACDMACGTPPNATVTCAMGRCERTCAAGFADCDMSPANGCEADTRASVAHCGRCGSACTAANGTPRCVNGECGVAACNAGFGDCDYDPANGCETDVRASAMHCGRCGATCNLANATATCTGGTCSVGVCNAGFADCDMNPANGCETPLQSTNAHCGMCGRACTTGEVCSAGVCTLTCPAGQTACGAGCFDLQTSAAHCGGCSMACPSAANAVSRCDTGRCAFTCVAGFADCDGMAANGCETDTRTSAAHCGTCRNACAAANGTPACESSRCAVATCNAGFADCDMTAANGCEADTRVSATHCGRCGNACVVANGTPTCAAGACGVAACNAGFGDCDMTATNGCETDVRTSARHCGMCGRTCAAGARCEAGTCVAPRNATDIRTADPSARSGTYTIDPDGSGPLPALPLYVDFDTDGGGWVLAWKSNMANNSDRTDTGHNVAALVNSAVNDVAVLPRAYIAALGTTFRLLSADGTRRFYWRGVPFYTTDNHEGRAAGSVLAVETTVDISRPFRRGEATFYPTHAVCIFDGLANISAGHMFAEHFCGGRWCCGPNAGAWWNYGRWNPGSYTSASVWVR